jgi:hypothetical protein
VVTTEAITAAITDTIITIIIADLHTVTNTDVLQPDQMDVMRAAIDLPDPVRPYQAVALPHVLREDGVHPCAAVAVIPGVVLL